MKFNYIDIPHQWKDEFTKYPHGYTIFEALCKWTKQVDDMVDDVNDWNDYLDNFVENFDFEVKEEVQSTIERWQSEGLLDDIIGSVLNTELDNVKTQLTELESDLNTELDSVKTEFEQNTTDYLSLGKELDNGVSDNYQKLLSVINDAEEQGKGLYIPNGKYFISENIVVPPFKNIKIDGEIFMGEGKTITFQGERGQQNQVLEIHRVHGKVRLYGFFNSYIRILGATELELYADGDGLYNEGAMAYSQFVLGRIEHFKITGVNGGWINENVFYGGRIFNLTISGDYIHNNNTFYKPQLENCVINIDSSAYTYFYDVRFEGQNTITFGENASSNKLFKSYHISKSEGMFDTVFSKVDYTDNGVGNEVLPSVYINSRVERVIEYNAYSPIYDKEAFYIDNEKLTIKNSWTRFVDTGIIPFETSFGINLESDKSLFRAYITLYDQNKSPIQDDEVISGTNLNYTMEQYRHNSNMPRFRLLFRKTSNTNVKFIKIELSTGGGVNDEIVDFINVNVVGKHTDNKLSKITESLKVVNVNENE